MGIDAQVFIERYGGIYEHSPWVAADAAGRLVDAGDVEAIAAAMARAVDEAPEARRLELIRAHPDLAGRAAIGNELSDASSAEQKGAGLDRCTPEEYRRFQALNARYRERFGFPFVIAVKGRNRADILDAFEGRLDNDYATEFATAIREIHRIARLRLDALGPMT